MKKKTKALLSLSVAAVAGMYLYNKYMYEKAEEKNPGNEKDLFYHWKEGAIHYKKIGEGKPILLLHNLDSASSSIEWQKIIKRLSMQHTVYAIDLIGYGHSEKPAMDYTIFLYVQLITNFIKDVIKEQTAVITSNMSAPIAIMTEQMDHNLINEIIMINPVSMRRSELIPDCTSKIKKNIINLPIIGTFLYHQLISRTSTMKTCDATFYNAHNQQGKGKYVYASILGNYLCQDMKNALKNTDKKITIIASTQLKDSYNIIRQYQKYNNKIETISISSSNLYPHMNDSEKVLKILEHIL